MRKLQEKRVKLEKQLTLQEMNETGKTGYLYGPFEPKIKGSQAKGRKVIINGYTLASAIVDAIKKKEKDYVIIPLATNKSLAIDLVTREVLYFNDRSGEESYLDSIEFCQEV